MTNPSEVPEFNRYSYVEPGSGGEDAIRREVEACIEEEIRKHGVVIWDDPVIERTDASNDDFKAKLAYWREHGAPAYHGPKAVEKQ